MSALRSFSACSKRCASRPATTRQLERWRGPEAQCFVKGVPFAYCSRALATRLHRRFREEVAWHRLELVRTFGSKRSGRSELAVELTQLCARLAVEGFKFYQKKKTEEKQRLLEQQQRKKSELVVQNTGSGVPIEVPPPSNAHSSASSFDFDMLYLLVPGALCVAFGSWAVYEFNEDSKRADLEETQYQLSLARIREIEQELKQDLKQGEWTTLAGTGTPPYWTTDQGSSLNPKSEFECVRITDKAILAALSSCLEGNDVGSGGRDAISSRRYSKLELANAWRIENRTLWGKFAAERQQVQNTMRILREDCGRAGHRVASVLPNIRGGLQAATVRLRSLAGFDPMIHEVYLFHGLGNPGVAVNVCSSGMNEHFSGVNAGTMFGDGIYFAEDMGKSDQYCAVADADTARTLRDTLGSSRRWFSGAEGDLRYVFLARVRLLLALANWHLYLAQKRQHTITASLPKFRLEAL